MAAIIVLTGGTVWGPFPWGSPSWGQLSFVEATADVGLDGLAGPHGCFVDLNNDGWPDVVIGRNRVFLHVADDSEDSPRGFRFVEVEENGLPSFRRGDIAVFADLDNDGYKDCVWTRYLDVHADGYEPPTEGPAKTAWLRGNGDGTFGEPIGTWEIIEPAAEATTAAVAVGDVNRDGWLDLYLGNWYVKYGEGLEGFRNDLLLQWSTSQSGMRFTSRYLARSQKTLDSLVVQRRREIQAELANLPDSLVPTARDLIRDDIQRRTEAVADGVMLQDNGGRPTYGTLICSLIAGVDSRNMFSSLGVNQAQLLELNYGRRWNRLWVWTIWGDHGMIDPQGNVLMTDRYQWEDYAPPFGLDGDAVRHGRHPAWLKERAKTDPRFDREDEKPFRSNGNTFDAAIGDIDNDGDFDLFLAEITHGWAGESSDRSRFLVQERDEHGAVRFVSTPELSVDRVPTDPTIRSWNQGDIFAELADFDLDGRLDLLLCSSDYPDNQRLRIYRQQADGTFSDITSWVGIDHLGAGQPSLADIDGDGDLDILVGQSFNRLRREQREGRTPQMRVYLNQAVERSLGNALVLRLVGDETQSVSRDALGAIVRMTATIGGERVTQSRQLIGIGGHQGKQMDFVVHFGLGEAAVAERVEIEWPARERLVTVLEDVEVGRHTVRLGESEVQE